MSEASIHPAPLIRPMRVEDLAQVMCLENAIYEFPWSTGNFRDSISAGYSCWVMLGETGLMAYAVLMIGVEEAHLLNLSVDVARQRGGLGSLMIAHLAEVSRGYDAARLLLEVRRSNDVARYFYLAHGFQVLGERRGYYPAIKGREDAIIMERTL